MTNRFYFSSQAFWCRHFQHLCSSQLCRSMFIFRCILAVFRIWIPFPMIRVHEPFWVSWGPTFVQMKCHYVSFRYLKACHTGSLQWGTLILPILPRASASSSSILRVLPVTHFGMNTRTSPRIISGTYQINHKLTSGSYGNGNFNIFYVQVSANASQVTSILLLTSTMAKLLLSSWNHTRTVYMS